MKRLADICDIQYGYAFDSKCFTEDSSYPQLVRIRDVKRGYSETYYSGNYPDEYILSEGDLLIGMDGEFNIARWKCSGALLNQRVCKLTTKVGTNEEYLRFAMLKSLKEIEQRTAFVTVKHLSAKELNKLELDVPELTKQDKIADTLSRLERVIEARKEELEELDELIKARFVEMFGDMLLNSKNWPEVRLDEIADIVSGITKGRKIKEQELFEVPYMAVSNVKDGYIDWTTVKTVMASQAEIDKYQLKPFDVLMTEGGDPDKVGRGAIIHEPPKNCIHQNHIFRVRLNRGTLLPEYMEQYLQQQKAKRYFLGCAKQTTGIASINMRQLTGLPVVVPEMQLQKEYVSFVHQVDKSKVKVQKALDETQKLFDSLMQQYFG
ncbi:restriction endonuclease subunit S [Blautia sp.]|mgnify:CR=1 FL=1|jgi:type I restriction enzyme S subunit|uniref:restriction endonuclease subunit S n=1 Tax=Blautia sp. TaxID=1955243 RepID=UPI003AF47556